MAVTEDFIRYVLEQLSGLRDLAPRRLFGGMGLYSDGAFFGLIAGDVLYFKVGDANQADYETRGMGSFHPFRDRPQIGIRYYEVPAEVLEDADECLIWARRSIDIAHTARARQPARPPRPKQKPMQKSKPKRPQNSPN